MIQVKTRLKVADNSGADLVRCIKTLGGFNRSKAYEGDFVLVSIKSLRLARKVKTGEMHYGIIVRTSKESHFKDGSFSKFRTNSVVLLSKKRRIIGTRLFGPVSKKLRVKKLLRLVIMSGKNMI
jgi:large subunit ribosomal protein L14